MSASAPESAKGAPIESTATPAPPRRHRHRRTLVGIGALALVVVTAIVLIDPFGRNDRHDVPNNPSRGSLATVTQGPLSSQVNASGTLGYAARADGSPYAIVNQASGVFTALPSPGRVVRCGQVVYRVANAPVVLLCGSTPAYRSLAEGTTGPDVRELNANLVRLGYATRAQLDPASDSFGFATRQALERLQDKLGVEQIGTLTLGQAIVLPGPVRIDDTTATLGTPAQPGGTVAHATSTRRQIRVDLGASQQSSVRVGGKALITLPDNKTARGTVTRIGTVASASQSDQPGGSDAPDSRSSSSPATVPVYITMRTPRAAGRLDQAPVQVQITTAGVPDATIVPVVALVPRPGGHYAVEAVDARGAHQLVPVTLGLFDDANGLVQVTDTVLTAGQRVVVTST